MVLQIALSWPDVMVSAVRLLRISAWFSNCYQISKLVNWSIYYRFVTPNANNPKNKKISGKLARSFIR